MYLTHILPKNRFTLFGMCVSPFKREYMLSQAKVDQLGITIDVYQKAAKQWVASGIYEGHHIVVENQTQGTAVSAWRDRALSVSDSGTA